EDGIRDFHVTGVQTCALPISSVGGGRRGRIVAARERCRPPLAALPVAPVPRPFVAPLSAPMSDPRFIHLRVHSEFSITDGIVRLPALVAAAADDAQPAVALTDLANMFGWIKFYKAARARGVKPILGVDCWVTNADDRDRPSRLLLLARNHAGYLRLCELVSRAWLENEWRG